MEKETSSENIELYNRLVSSESGNIQDAIGAYFKSRCASSRESMFFVNTELNRESSVGVFDTDKLSSFGDELDSDTSYSRFLRNSSTVVLDQLKREYNLNDNEEQCVSEADTLTADPEANLEKQRALAQETLKNLNKKDTEADLDATLNTFELTKENLAKNDRLEKLLNKKTSLSTGGNTNWFQPNFSPNTPRIFNDELSSLGGDESDFTLIPNNPDLAIKQNQLEEKTNKESENNKLSLNGKSMNHILKEFNHLSINKDMEFDSCTTEEQIKRLEEDEKKFMSENVLPHNSGISQFSGIDEADINFLSNNFCNNKENEQSIGQYFSTRSNRISSLIKPKSDLNNDFNFEFIVSLCNTLKTEKSNPGTGKSSRESILEAMRKGMRNSNESSASSSLMMVREILSELDSGLTPDELADKILNKYEFKTAEKERKKKIVTPNNVETPKTSKTRQRKQTTSKPSEKLRESTSAKFSNYDLQILTPTSDFEFKENMVYPRREDTEAENKPDVKSDFHRGSKIKSKMSFDASTPKFPNRKFQSKNVKAPNEFEWDLPSISSVQLTNDCTKEEINEGNDVTLVNVNCGKTAKTNTTLMEATNIEDTIVAGDLTWLSKRIEDFKEESVCIVRPIELKEPVLLTVIQKLADYPKGSVDCTAVIPLLRDQFPELLSAYPTPGRNQSIFSNLSTIEEEDLVISEPGSWVKLPAQVGYNEKIHSLIEIKKSIFIPLVNVSKNWLMLSLESINLVQQGARKKGNNPVKILECPVTDFINVIMKDTLVPPESHQNLQVDLVPLIEAKIDLKLKISVKQMLGKEVQVRSLFIRTTTLNATKLLQILTEETINFGFLSDECYDSRTVQISFNGISELPLMVFIEEKNPDSQYSFKSVNASPNTDEKIEFDCQKFYHLFKEGEKQLLEFEVLFEPKLLEVELSVHKVFEAYLVLKIATTTVSDGVLRRIPMKSTVGTAKFLFSPSCNPLVFNATEKGQLIQKSYPVKNVGSLPIGFSMRIINRENEDENDDIFLVEKSFFISTNEESAIEITYRADKPAKRALILHIEPNGKRAYKIDLIGELNLTEARCVSPPKSITSNQSAFSSRSVAAKIVATTRSLSWPAVGLDSEVKQTLQVKNDSDLNLTARIYFSSKTNSFKFLNEDGEKVQKLRKVLKPRQPFTLTVIFHPDSLGLHCNYIFLETVEFGLKKIKKFMVCGVGGLPNIIISNVKTDLSGCKMLFLQKPTANVKNYCNKLLFKNTGPFPGFVVIMSNPTHSLNNELDVNPSRFIIDSESSFEASVSQKLKSIDIHGLLSEKDICKLANLTLIMGDNLSRLRFKELVESGKALIPSNCSKMFISDFLNEKKVNLEKFDDTQGFVKYFFKSLKILEVIVAVEKSSDTCEPTVFLDEDDSVSLFETICTTMQNPLYPKFEDKTLVQSDIQQTNAKLDGNNSGLSSNSSYPLRKKIQDWLENIELDSQQ